MQIYCLIIPKNKGFFVRDKKPPRGSRGGLSRFGGTIGKIIPEKEQGSRDAQDQK